MRGKPKISNPELYRTIRRYLEDSGQGMYVHVLHHIATTLRTSIDALMEEEPCGQ